MRSHNQSQDVEIVVKKVISGYLEKFLLFVLIVSGLVLIYFAKDASDFIPSLLLNLGSNIVVFCLYTGFFNTSQEDNQEKTVKTMKNTEIFLMAQLFLKITKILEKPKDQEE